ncbi:MAG TPA: lipase family protein [Flavisolibacter sp.]|nr:lipase family protein [Flavisolibacter sp.]
MKVSAQFGDSAYAAKLPPLPGYRFLYRSPVTGLDNCWELWQTDAGHGIISIRGTTSKEISWVDNFYAAMVPAKGTLQLSKTDRFDYNLSDHPRAAVHVGWLVATGFLSKSILFRIDSLYTRGVKDIYIIGHSQGGAIAFLLTAYLYQLQKKGSLPADIRFKTYCSAGPKPGNLYFAYDYEAATQGGWAFNVVNAADWVPQSPFSLQTVGDFHQISPFTNARSAIKKQGWPKRWILNTAYARLARPSNKALRRYKKYLGSFVAKAVKKHLDGFEEPRYYNSNDYARTGQTITLVPGDDYYREYPQDGKNIFINHFHGPYLYLLQRLDLNKLPSARQ